jgi:hypothetical protein
MDRLSSLSESVIPAVAAHAYDRLWATMTESERLAYELANRREIVVH